jgi:hypothetical protein
VVRDSDYALHMLLSAMGRSERAKRDRHKATIRMENFSPGSWLVLYVANLTTVPIFVACTVTLPSLANSLKTLPTCALLQSKVAPARRERLSVRSPGLLEKQLSSEAFCSYPGRHPPGPF